MTASEIFPHTWPYAACGMEGKGNHEQDPNTWLVCPYSRPGLPQEAVKWQTSSREEPITQNTTEVTDVYSGRQMHPPVNSWH